MRYIRTLSHETTREIRYTDRNDRGEINAIFTVTYDPSYEDTANIAYWCVYKKVGGKVSAVDLPMWIMLG